VAHLASATTLPPTPATSATPATPAIRPTREGTPAPTDSTGKTARTLTVGRGLVLSGKIEACDILIVEGTLTADIAGCRELHVAPGGLFTGSASVETAEIRGRFEGALNVSGRLLIHANGKVAAEVRYNQIEIERGGEISGHVQAQDGQSAATPLPRRA
jgi:cytoskeletal protein CcmA (bactofilin family)